MKHINKMRDGLMSSKLYSLDSYRNSFVRWFDKNIRNAKIIIFKIH